MQKNLDTVKKSWIDRMLDSIEKAGNKLPDPITLFIILAGIIYITYHIKYEVWLFLAILDFVQDDYTHDKNKLKQS